MVLSVATESSGNHEVMVRLTLSLTKGKPNPSMYSDLPLAMPSVPSLSPARPSSPTSPLRNRAARPNHPPHQFPDRLPPILAQVPPRRIHAHDQGHLLDPLPALDLLLPRDRVPDPGERLVIHQPVQPVAAGESLVDVVFMLPSADFKFAGHTGVKSLRPVGHDVDVKRSRLST